MQGTASVLFFSFFFFTFGHIPLVPRSLGNEASRLGYRDLRASPKVSPLHVPSRLQNNSVGTRASFLRRR